MKNGAEEIASRLDNIEEILKLLLIQSVLTNSEIERIQENTISKVGDILLPLGMKNPRLNYIEGHYYIFVEPNNTDTLKKIKNHYIQAKELIPDMKIVLAFEMLHSKRKKAFEDAKISYYITKGEMKIF